MATVYSAGHGNRSVEGLIALLTSAGTRRLVDIRAMPRSRRYPHFGYGPLGAALEAAGIAYDWRGSALGGFRRGAGDERHHALAEPAFRAFASYMETERFRRAAVRLAEDAQAEPVCVLCAERDPSRCHRALLADWLLAHGHRVLHLIEPGESRTHALHADAVIVEGVIRYAGGGPQRSLF